MDTLLSLEAVIPLWLRAAVGLVLLIGGAEYLVRGASRMARGLGVPPLVVGLTVVSFGTSAPELAVSVSGSLTGAADVAVGNIVGSNIMNVLLILGLSAVVAPLRVQSQLVRLDVPLMIAASFGVWALALNGYVSQAEGLLLVTGLLGYLVVVFVVVRRGGKAAVGADDVPEAGDKPAYGRDVLLVVVGLVALTLGSRWLVDGATAAASALGVSQLVIGLTVVAIGTSLPELATSVLASIRGERDIAVGNVVGSNLFNLLCVLGVTASLPPAGVPVADAAVYFDLPVMVAVAVLCFPIFVSGGQISRREGTLMLVYFVGYMVYVLLSATEHDALRPFSWAFFVFFVPLTAVGLFGAMIASLRTTRRRQKRLRRLLGERHARPTYTPPA